MAQRMIDHAMRRKFQLDYEMSAFKCDNECTARGERVFSQSTERATLTIVCMDDDCSLMFAFRALAEFQGLMMELDGTAAARVGTPDLLPASSASQRAEPLCVTVRRRVAAHESLCTARWLILFMDASFVHVYGRGRFACYFLGSQNEISVSGALGDAETHETQFSLANHSMLTLLVTTTPTTTDDAKLRRLLTASRSVVCATDALALAYVKHLVTESGFCVLTITGTRARAAATAAAFFADEADAPPMSISRAGAGGGSASSSSSGSPPGSPKKSALHVLDTNTASFRNLRRCLVQTSSYDDDDYDEEENELSM